MSRRRTGAGTVAALALACVFGAAMLLSLAAGAGVYRRVAARVEQAAGERVGLTYITAKIHGCDARGSVYVGDFGGVDAVYLLEDLGGQTYETILYVYDGYLMELFCEQDPGFSPEDGETITPAQSLAAAQVGDDLLRLTYTDAGGSVETADIYLRSGAPRERMEYQL